MNAEIYFMYLFAEGNARCPIEARLYQDRFLVRVAKPVLRTRQYSRHFHSLWHTVCQVSSFPETIVRSTKHHAKYDYESDDLKTETSIYTFYVVVP